MCSTLLVLKVDQEYKKNVADRGKDIEIHNERYKKSAQVQLNQLFRGPTYVILRNTFFLIDFRCDQKYSKINSKKYSYHNLASEIIDL